MYKARVGVRRALPLAGFFFFGLVAGLAFIRVAPGHFDLDLGKGVQDQQKTALAAGTAEALMSPREQTRKSSKPEQLAAAEIKNYLTDRPIKLAPGETFVDGVRRFVSENSVHRIDDVFRSYGNDLGLMMRKMLHHAQGRADRPHLECSTRSGAMLELLNTYGVRSRQVFLLTDVQKELKSHTFLEVWDESSGNWEIQDPDYDTYYIERTTGERVGAERILREPIDRFVPCRAPGNCSWRYAEELRDFFDAVGYKDGVDDPIVIVNSARFDLDKIFEDPSGGHDLETYIRKEWSVKPPKILIVH